MTPHVSRAAQLCWHTCAAIPGTLSSALCRRHSVVGTLSSSTTTWSGVACDTAPWYVIHVTCASTDIRGTLIRLPQLAAVYGIYYMLIIQHVTPKASHTSQGPTFNTCLTQHFSFNTCRFSSTAHVRTCANAGRAPSKAVTARLGPWAMIEMGLMSAVVLPPCRPQRL